MKSVCLLMQVVPSGIWNLPDRTGTAGCGRQKNLVPSGSQAPGQHIHDGLDAAIGRRRDLYPRRGDQADAHRGPTAETLMLRWRRSPRVSPASQAGSAGS